jgi:hypothetical protein
MTGAGSTAVDSEWSTLLFVKFKISKATQCDIGFS